MEVSVHVEIAVCVGIYEVTKKMNVFDTHLFRKRSFVKLNVPVSKQVSL